MTKQMLNEKSEAQADAVEIASYRASIKGLPITLRPALNSQLAEWETLFPFEKRRTQEFMRGVASFSPSALEALFEPMRRVEAKMGVARWEFSQSANTLENASLLARSAYYTEWREEVQRIYASVEAAAQASAQPPTAQPRLIVAILPECLPFERTALWKKWGGRGVEVQIDGDAARIHELLLQGPSSIHSLLAQQGSREISDFWLIDAGSKPPALSAGPGASNTLNYAALRALRDHVLAQVNSISKNIEMTDRTLASIRDENWDQWWPADLEGPAPLRKFVIDLYLSGNGALIFSNAFVEWAASEAIRRARPRVLFARFGLRAKPKPFTGIAIFENQQRISALPDVDDPQGSAVDAFVLARYILLSAQRYAESAQTVFLCIAESIQSAYLVIPEAFKAGWTSPNKATPKQIAQWIIDYLSSQPKGDG